MRHKLILQDRNCCAFSSVLPQPSQFIIQYHLSIRQFMTYAVEKRRIIKEQRKKETKCLYYIELSL
jgi:hypothetical protein